MTTIGSILIVDADEAFRDSIALRLRENGFECHTFQASDEALDDLRRRRFDLLITEIASTSDSHAAIVYAAREFDDQMPIILVANQPSPQAAIRSVELSVAGYLTKPLEFDELLWHVHSAIAHSRNRRAVNAVRGRLQSCLLDLDHVRSVPAASGIHGMVSLGTIRTLAASLAELLDLCTPSRVHAGSQNLCELIDCRQHADCRKAMADAVDVLKKTKDLFKSKALADLRTRFERILGQ